MAVFLGGLPTDIALNKLKETYPVPEVGRIYLHSDIEAVIGHSYRSSHYRSVLERWKKWLMHEHSLEGTGQGEARGQGVLICDPRQALREAGRRFTGFRKATKKNLIKVAVIRTGAFTPQELDTYNLSRREAEALATAAAQAAKTFSVPEPPKALPMRQAV